VSGGEFVHSLREGIVELKFSSLRERGGMDGQCNGGFEDLLRVFLFLRSTDLGCSEASEIASKTHSFSRF
jgi:hypothetical protein